MSIGPPEIVFLFILALLLFGPKRLPEVGRTVGQALRELKRMSSEVTTAFEEAMEERPRSTSHEWDMPDSPGDTGCAGAENDPDSPYRDAEELAVDDEEEWVQSQAEEPLADPAEGESPGDTEAELTGDESTEGYGEAEISPPERGG